MVKGEPREFHYKDAHFHIVTEAWDPVVNRIIEERLNLETFIEKNEYFKTALTPLSLKISEYQPESVRRMLTVSAKTGLGPMAAVAGTMAQLAGEKSRDEGSSNTIIENGGDIYMDCMEDLLIGLYVGKNPYFQNLALEIPLSLQPLAICTSSGRMGHSLSFGDCDIVSVFSSDASLADSAATLGCNSVHADEDIEEVLNKLIAIEGVTGAIIIRDKHFGTVGQIPGLIKNNDPRLKDKISRDDQSNFK